MAVYAYLDPGTGSYVFQILMATSLGVLYAIKLFWRHGRSCLKASRAGNERPNHDP